MDDEEFNIPIPPGFPPGVPPGRDVMFFREGAPPSGTKEHEDIMLRRVPRDTAMRFRGSAGGRGMTHAQFLSALVDLHRRARDLADAGNEQLERELTELGLASVTV